MNDKKKLTPEQRYQKRLNEAGLKRRTFYLTEEEFQILSSHLEKKREARKQE